MSTSRWLEPEELSDVAHLSAEECWTAMASQRIGRLAVAAEDGVDIFPVNFIAKDHKLFFRSAPGSKLEAIAHSSRVAFETDGAHLLSRWSVIVRGDAHRLSDEAEILATGIQSLDTMTSSHKWNYIRITPTAVTGVSFRR